MSDRYEEFLNELTQLINKYSMENASNTPDFILAKYIQDNLQSLAGLIQQRESWYGRDPRPSEPKLLLP